MMAKLDEFTRAYVEAALWSSTDNADDQGGEPLDKNYGPGDIAPETMELIVEDCADFQERYAELLSDSGIEDGRAGHDFWLSRVGHGSGFFDEDTIDEEFQDPLQDAAESYGEFDLYVDDGVIYGPPTDWYREHRKHPPIAREAPRRPVLRPRAPPPPQRRRTREAAPRRAGRGTPTGNVFWRDIPPGSSVALVGHSYVVTLPDGRRASAYWGGDDARQAQRYLDSLVRRDTRPTPSHPERRPAPRRR